MHAGRPLDVSDIHDAQSAGRRAALLDAVNVCDVLMDHLRQTICAGTDVDHGEDRIAALNIARHRIYDLAVKGGK
jgi:hypothetical protein